MCLGGKTIDSLLRLRGDTDFTAKNYNRAIELFLSKHPDGTLKKAKCHVDGQNYPKKRKSVNKSIDSELSLWDINNRIKKVTDVDLSYKSDDEWSDEENMNEE